MMNVFSVTLYRYSTRYNRKLCVAVSLSLLVSFQLYAQPTDTLELARAKAYEKDFAGADALLTKYNADHPDINALRLHAQVLYWTRAFNRSIATYQKAMHLFPHEKTVLLEYGRTLFNLNKLSKAKVLLNEYVRFDSLHAEANLMLAYIDLWTGHIARAKKRAAFILLHYPENGETLTLLHETQIYTAPYVKAGPDLASDDQPRKAADYTLEGGVYRSWFLSPVAKASFYHFQSEDSSYHSSWVRVKNTLQPGGGLSFLLGAGVFEHGHTHTRHFTGSVSLSQIIAKRWALTAGFEQLPYQYSIASLKTPVLEGVSSLSVSYNKNDKWLGKAGYELQHFEDDNTINTFYFWLLAPLVHKNHFSLKAGYAYSFANAYKNNFVSAAPLSKAVISVPLHGSLPGMYDSYFTPQSQVVHAIAASLRTGISKTASLSSRISVGVSAKADNPVLTLEKQGNQFYIRKEYASINYTPVTWVTDLQIGVSKKVFIGGNYTLDHLVFYTSNQGNLQLKYLF